jgi:hypothetical protein
LYRALAYRFQAMAHWDKAEHGLAIGLLQQAMRAMKPRPDPTSQGLPALNESPVLRKYQVRPWLVPFGMVWLMCVVCGPRRMPEWLLTLLCGVCWQANVDVARKEMDALLAQWKQVSGLASQRASSRPEGRRSSRTLGRLFRLTCSSPVWGLCVSLSFPCVQENNLIYFSQVPDAAELPPLPQGTMLVTLTKYEYR